MAGLEIGLVVIGVLIFAGSFFITEKLSSSDMKEITKISEKEVHNIVDQRIAQSENIIKDRLADKLEDAVNDFVIRTDEEYVNKMNQMNDYSEKVLETMEKTNSEIVFIHSMLSDKQDNVNQLTDKLEITQKQLLQLKNDVDESINSLKEQYDQNINLKKEQEFVTGIEAAHVETETVKTFNDELIEKIADTDDEDVPEGFKEAVNASVNESVNDNHTMSSEESEIVNLYKEGYSEIDIAKKLGKGIGEIKLVLGLYN